MQLGHRGQRVKNDLERYGDPYSGWRLERNEAERKLCRTAVKDGSDVLIQLGTMIFRNAFQDPERTVGDSEMVSSVSASVYTWLARGWLQ